MEFYLRIHSHEKGFFFRGKHSSFGRLLARGGMGEVVEDLFRRILSRG